MKSHRCTPLDLHPSPNSAQSVDTRLPPGPLFHCGDTQLPHSHLRQQSGPLTFHREGSVNPRGENSPDTAAAARFGEPTSSSFCLLPQEQKSDWDAIVRNERKTMTRIDLPSILPERVHGRLYISGIGPASSKTKLRENEIDQVITCNNFSGT